MTSESTAIEARAGDDRLRIPRHLAVTMDGNGRWARARGKPRTDGHAEGHQGTEAPGRYCISYGVEYLTIFSFSSENWSRPESEVSFLFSLMARFVESDLKKLIANNVHVHFLGSRQRLDRSIVKLMDDVEARSAQCAGLRLEVAFTTADG